MENTHDFEERTPSSFLSPISSTIRHHPDSRWTQLSNRRSGSPAQLHHHDIPHALNTSSISVGMVTGGSGYPSMPIPIKKRSNPNRYERVVTADHESRRKISSICYSTTDCLLMKEEKKRKNNCKKTLL